jgi:hypothetical protein
VCVCVLVCCATLFGEQSHGFMNGWSAVLHFLLRSCCFPLLYPLADVSMKLHCVCACVRLCVHVCARVCLCVCVCVHVCVVVVVVIVIIVVVVVVVVVIVVVVVVGWVCQAGPFPNYSCS